MAARMGTASSEVAINTAISVPRVITFEPYRFAAMAENPHCGTSPSTAPGKKPKRPPPASTRSTVSEWRCSKNSISR